MNNSNTLGFEINTLRVVKIKSRWQPACWCMKSVPLTGSSLVPWARSRAANELSVEWEQRSWYLGSLVSILCRFMRWKMWCIAEAWPPGPGDGWRRRHSQSWSESLAKTGPHRGGALGCFHNGSRRLWKRKWVCVSVCSSRLLCGPWEWVWKGKEGIPWNTLGKVGLPT